ncbi:MAG: OmpA family protein [Saprospiraceae bacterium]|nr:OmpA family protein [Saprospiraceae bacterium]
MKIPLWLIALLFAGYTVWCANYWHNYCKERCCEETPAVSATTGEPLFLWNAQRPEADTKFPDWKKALLAKGGQGDTLVITTWYRANEPGGQQLALARGEALKSMMMPEMPESRIKILTKLAPDDGLAEGSPAKASADFSWSKMILKAEQSAIIESDNDITFLFPTNSTERDRNPDVEAYLNKLIEKHKSTTNTFTIVGYTDDVGEADENQRLGLARARAIALFLAKNGIDAKRINKVESKGEADPVADNSTEDGRRQNRRVVLTVNR